MASPSTPHAATMLVLFGLLVAGCAAQPALAQEAHFQARCAVLEVFIRADGESERSQAARDFAEETYGSRPGIILTVRDVAHRRDLDRYWKLMDHFQVQKPGLPAFYVSGQIQVGWDPSVTPDRISEALTVEAFVREGCPRCRDAHPIIFQQLATRYPGYRFVEREITRSAESARRLQQLAQRYGVRATSVPALHMCGRLMVGFINADTSHRQWDDVLRHATVPCPQQAPAEADRQSRAIHPRGDATFAIRLGPSLTTTLGQLAEPPPPRPNTDISLEEARQRTDEDFVEEAEEETESPAENDADDVPNGSIDAPPADAPPRRPAANRGPPGEETVDDSWATPSLPPLPSPTDDIDNDRVSLPFIGDVHWRQWGLPAFTLMVGLVDGFNPCAMWVLLFLLSVLVNLHDRWKILAVAGTFVVISGLAYLAFMAAWLNVFQLVGLLRPAQITLGVLGIAVGLIHIKDFFAFKRGISLSIPESAKPGLYARVRRIVLAESLTAAVLGASVLAVLVNIVELLCTAGLPAMYTGILTMQELSPWQNYGYLLLYIAAYMFDDALMVAVVVLALGRPKLQERGGRILKLISGLVIVALGAVMIWWPEWLV